MRLSRSALSCDAGRAGCRTNLPGVWKTLLPALLAHEDAKIIDTVRRLKERDSKGATPAGNPLCSAENDRRAAENDRRAAAQELRGGLQAHRGPPDARGHERPSVWTQDNDDVPCQEQNWGKGPVEPCLLH